MTKQVNITPEIAGLAKNRGRFAGTSPAFDLARNIAQESIVNLDPELNLLLDDSETYSQEDALVAAFGVNDICVNGCRLHVAVLEPDGSVSVSRALVGTSYLKGGTLAVRMENSLSGSVVAFISAAQWQTADKAFGKEQHVNIKVKMADSFDLAGALLKAIEENRSAFPANLAPQAPDMVELATFVAGKGELIIARQRQIVESSLLRPDTWGQVAQVVNFWSKGRVRQMLSLSAAWNRKVEKLAEVLAPRFCRLSRQELQAIIERTGETYGTQVESADFRQALFLSASREELSRALGGEALRKATQIVEQVLGGRPVADVVKDFAASRVAVDLAMAIKRQRQKVAGFVEASADELSAAFRNLALQPVYAVHSQDPASGIESINEVLKMLDAGDLAEQLKAVEKDLLEV